jgi:hypothetical protein
MPPPSQSRLLARAARPAPGRAAHHWHRFCVLRSRPVQNDGVIAFHPRINDYVS